MPYRIIWSWYTGRWWVGCYVWYSDEGTGRGPSPPRPLITVPNVTACPSTASVPITVLLYNGPLLCCFNVPIKGLNVWWFLGTQFQFGLSFFTPRVPGFILYDNDRASQRHFLSQFVGFVMKRQQHGVIIQQWVTLCNTLSTIFSTFLQRVTASSITVISSKPHSDAQRQEIPRTTYCRLKYRNTGISRFFSYRYISYRKTWLTARIIHCTHVRLVVSELCY